MTLTTSSYPGAVRGGSPANPFVMGFLGEVADLGGVALRPHDIEVSVEPRLVKSAVSGTVTRLLRVGFEVRVTVAADDGTHVLVVLTRTHARDLALAEGVALQSKIMTVMLPMSGFRPRLWPA